MKKSELYHLAQIAVINSPSISPEKKLQVLRILMEREDFEDLLEEREFEKAVAEIEAELAADEE